MSSPATLEPFILEPGALSVDEVMAFFSDALWLRADVAVVELSGSGAIACLQGLLTNDVERPGEGSFVYGAVLTPKGMIRCDMWVVREANAALLFPPPQGLGVLLEVLSKSVPPRLAAVRDRTAEIEVHRLLGPQALKVARDAGFAVPEPGRWTTMLLAGTTVTVARPAQLAPFVLQIHGPPAASPEIEERLEAQNVVRGGPNAMELARIITGWPRLGAEIDDKTLPQEVRFDEIDGVSYTKGCYVGQETVARLHFRGHTNRSLCGLWWTKKPYLGNAAVIQDGRERGWVTSMVWIEPGSRWVGLAKIRRETDRERPVIAAMGEAKIVGLPIRFIA
ncbi:MAG: glycine cleavage system protein T [Gemmatimonadales bacterium]|nr:tRNA-modifying protein YgfZ [bacterium HR33]GIW51926.1 MAG: glycine cleavage system protein T [Gemmatimonadales bacterium]